MIKKINLTGMEQAVKFADTHTHYWVQNLGGGDVMAGLEPELAESKDDVLIVPSGGVGYVRLDTGTKTVYLSGTGKVQVYGTNNSFCPFKGGTKGGDEITSEGVIMVATVEYPIVGLNLYGKSVQNGTPTPEAPVDIVSVGDDGVAGVTACGKNLLNISVDLPLTAAGVTISRDSKGNIILNGTATSSYTFTLGEFNLPYNTYTLSINSKIQGVGIDCKNFATLRAISTSKSVTVESSGNDKIYGNVSSGTTFDNFVLNPQLEIGSEATAYEPYTGSTAEITTGLPLGSVGDVRDELIYNADGTGKIIKRTAKLNSYNGEEITTAYISSTGGLDTGAEVVYVLTEPQEIALSTAEITELIGLHTLDGVTNIYNYDGTEMSVKVATNPMISEFVKPVMDGYEKRIANLEAAVLSFGGNV